MLNQDDKDYVYTYEYEILTVLLVKPEYFKKMPLQDKHFKFFNKHIDLCKKSYLKNGIIDSIEISKEIEGFMNFYMECALHFLTESHFDFHCQKIIEYYKKDKIDDLFKNYNEEKIDYDELKVEIKKIDDECNLFNNDNDEISEEEIFEKITTKDDELEFSIFNKLAKKYGFIKKGIHVISARTSVGKSAFAINIMDDLARNYLCVYLNMEMNDSKIYQRMISADTLIPVKTMTSGYLNDEQKNRLKESIRRNRQNLNYKIINGSQTVNSIRKIITKYSKNQHLVLFVDYIGYVHTDKPNQNDRERIGEATRELQLMTKDYDCTIFMLVQINREGIDAPTLTHLKDSGEIEQSAETVIILHNQNPDPNEDKPIYSLIMAKNRNGSKGVDDILFDKQCQKFYEV